MPRLEDATELIELCQSKENTACTLAVTFSPSVSSRPAKCFQSVFLLKLTKTHQEQTSVTLCN